MRTIFNFLWCITVWWILWSIYFLISLVFSLTLILNPLWESMRQIAKLLFAPFGKEIIKDADRSGYNEKFGLIFNIIWFPFGLILSIIHIIIGIGSIITIVGIPSGIVNFKLAKAIIFPIGIRVVNQKEYVQSLVKEELKKQQSTNTIESKETNTISEKVLSDERKYDLVDTIKTSEIRDIPKENFSDRSSSEPQKEDVIIKIFYAILIFWLGFIVPYLLLGRAGSFFWGIYILFYTLSFVWYLNLKLNLIEKIYIKNEYVDILKSLNKYFIFFVVLAVTLLIWYISFMSGRSSDFFTDILMISIFHIHIIMFLITSYSEAWKIEWFASEFNKMKEMKSAW